MNIEEIKKRFKETSIYHSEPEILHVRSIIGYEKKFKWTWMATQLNTFIVVTDFKDKEIDEDLIKHHLSESFQFAKQNHKGWPRGVQSGVAVISVLISSKVSGEAKEYCQKLKSGKSWAGFSIPIVHDSKNHETYQFDKNPIWGNIYYPHFKKLVNSLK